MGDRLGTPGAVGFSSFLGHIWWRMLLIPLVLVFQGWEHLVMSTIMSINSCYYEPQVTHSNENFLTIYSLFSLSLLGLMAKIKCSICSYQFNIWYAGHSPAHILIWFLAFGQGSEACLTLTTGCLGIALQPSAAHYLTNENYQAFNHNYCDIGRYGDIPISRNSEILIWYWLEIWKVLNW